MIVLLKLVLHLIRPVGIPLLLACVSGTLSAAELDLGLRGSLLAGYESNPLRVSENEQGGAFSELRLDAGLNLGFTSRSGIFVELGGLQRVYESENSDADYGVANVKTGLNLILSRRGGNDLAVSLGVRLGTGRSTFIDPRTGLAYEIPQGNSGNVADLADRFNVDSLGTFLDIQWSVNRRVKLFLDALLERNDFVEDYEFESEVNSLDNRRLVLRPGIRITPIRYFRITLSAARSEIDYDQWLARDQDGSEAPGAKTSYQYTSYRLELDLAPAANWDARLGIVDTDRQDQYRGYYDFAGVTTFAWLQHKIGPRTRWTLYSSLGKLDYRNATVTNDPASEIRSSDFFKARGLFERDVSDHLTLFFEAGTLSTDNTDSDYSYDRDWTLVGLKFRLSR